MTPDKNKKPLPSSTSFIFPERPTTYQQWKLNLQAVKILYLRGQWKHCAARCCQLLNEAVSLVSQITLDKSYLTDQLATSFTFDISPFLLRSFQ